MLVSWCVFLGGFKTMLVSCFLGGFETKVQTRCNAAELFSVSSDLRQEHRLDVTPRG